MEEAGGLCLAGRRVPLTLVGGHCCCSWKAPREEGNKRVASQRREGVNATFSSIPFRSTLGFDARLEVISIELAAIALDVVGPTMQGSTAERVDGARLPGQFYCCHSALLLDEPRLNFDLCELDRCGRGRMRAWAVRAGHRADFVARRRPSPQPQPALVVSSPVP